MRYTIFDYLVSTSKTYRTSITGGFFVCLFSVILITRSAIVENKNIDNKEIYTGVLTEIGLVKIKKEDSYLFSFNKKVDKSVLKITLDNQKDFYIVSGLIEYWDSIQENMSIGHEYSIIFYRDFERENVLEIKTENSIVLASDIVLRNKRKMEYWVSIILITSLIIMFILIYKRKQFTRKTRGMATSETKVNN